MNEYLVPRLIFQPVIENAYKYAFPKEEVRNLNSHITVKFERHLGDLQIYIIDNGVGMDSEALNIVRESMTRSIHKEGGIGLSNTNKRIQLLFGKRFGVQVNSVVGRGTDVLLTIPMLSVKSN
jgi:two-component system sensor histidine kinase YesM